MREAFAAMRQAFVAMRCEGKDANHEESCGHHALHGVRDPSRERRSECVGSSSGRETTRPARVGHLLSQVIRRKRRTRARILVQERIDAFLLRLVGHQENTP
jgi:hypothetical protein